MNIAIILAGGTGTRVGADVPKQFIEIMGKPILAYTLEIFQNDDKIDAIEIVCHKDWIDEVRHISDKYGISKTRWITVGGATFQESTLNGVFQLKDKINPDDIVVISFGVSPMTTQDIIDDSIRVCEEHGNAISSEDMVLCTCIKDDEYSTTQNLIRENIKGFSNPWTFKYGELCETYEEAMEQGILDTLEPHTTSVYMALGKRLWFSKSNAMNRKITTREDLDIFEGSLLLQEKRKKEKGK
ncbi:IspD/TarI family cytidylyltransferase [Holdemania massiliensis]|uniref:IspD/TarI family cytidylyltransferase n=1 Tax=Holdemania massiliensis TaxID=1468449 RepID=UPI001F070DBE|nr:IspD/TarI family cytidylyltransferase [Holdemania massiliensis]MCH1940957.1 2-C-methyl-D-erythritol 4-phosphate cytidylyltransferase [Holdemania massiliensis]